MKWNENVAGWLRRAKIYKWIITIILKFIMIFSLVEIHDSIAKTMQNDVIFVYFCFKNIKVFQFIGGVLQIHLLVGKERLILDVAVFLLSSFILKSPRIWSDEHRPIVRRKTFYFCYMSDPPEALLSLLVVLFQLHVKSHKLRHFLRIFSLNWTKSIIPYELNEVLQKWHFLGIGVSLISLDEIIRKVWIRGHKATQLIYDSLREYWS